MAKGKKAVFLDRDGTLNYDPGYVRHPDELVLLPGAGEALRKLKDLGFLLIVVSNQSGVSRGLIPKNMITRIHERFNELLVPYGVQIDAFKLCFHMPEEKCSCRKPSAGLLLEASQEMGISLEDSYMVGDRLSDFLAGKNAGCRASYLVLTGDGKKNLGFVKETEFVIDHIEDLAEKLA